MKVLDLFCGLGGWSRGFHDILPNAEYYGLDIKDFGYPFNFIKADVNDWTPDQKYDIVLASPPCTEFSELKRNTASHPYDERIGLDLIWKTFDLISIIKPTYWLIENVRGLQEFIPDVREIIRYNKRKNGKAACLWGNFPTLGFFEEEIIYHPECWHKKNGWDENNRAMRALIPKALSRHLAQRISEELRYEGDSR